MDGGVIFVLAVMDVCATCIVRINAVEKTIMQLLPQHSFGCTFHGNYAIKREISQRYVHCFRACLKSPNPSSGDVILG